ncbi:MAG TPA: AI-2E family transporter [Dehalococcoidia bacterium]|nr:AI-2E family transporter [Dehalococcoidia bacterium]
MIRLEVSYRGIIVILLALATFWALTELWPVILLVLTSLIIMIGVLPYVEALVARGIPRSLAVLALVLTFLVIMAALFSAVVPVMIDEFQDLRNNLPQSGREIDELLGSLGIDTNLEQRAREVNWNELISGRAAVDYGQRVLSATLSLITVVVMTAYLLLEMPNLARFLYQFIPADKEEDYDRLFQDMSRVVGGYLRGQFITSLTIGVYTFVVLRIIGIPNPLAFAVVAAFADIIPIVGAFIAIIPPVAAALQESSTQALIVLGLLMAYQQFEDRFFVPRVYGRTLNLPPVIVLIAVLAGAELLGITGVLLALPLTAAGRVWLDYALRLRGVSLSPVEPEVAPAAEGEQPFAPDTEPEKPAEPPRTSLTALAGRRLPRLRRGREGAPEAPQTPAQGQAEGTR